MDKMKVIPSGSKEGGFDDEITGTGKDGINGGDGGLVGGGGSAIDTID